MTWVLAVAAGAAGALLRAEISASVQESTGAARLGTTLVNVVGAFLLGLLVAANPPGDDGAVRVLGTGFLGGFTTFSTWMVQSVGEPDWLRSAVIPLVSGVVAATAGVLVAAFL